MLYSIGFVLALIGLLGLMLDRKGLEALRLAFFPGLGLWFLGLITSAASLQVVLGQSFTDLLFLGGAALLFRAVATTRFAVPLSIVALLAMVAFHQAFEPQQQQESPESAAEALDNSLNLDSGAELLVELNHEENWERWKRWIMQQGWETSRAFDPSRADQTDLDDYCIVNIPADQMTNIESIMQRIEETGWVDWVEPNEIIQIEINPARTLPKLNKQLGVNDPGVSEQWALAALEMDKLYRQLNDAQVRPQKKTLIVVLDTGVDAQHEDLKGNFRSIKKSHNNDPQGHGTHCAGIIGAVTNNGVGVASYARNNEFFEISSVKVLSAGGSGTQQSIIKGMIEAVDAGADVLSMSLGGFSTQSRQRAYSQAVKYATDRGAIVVASAGNSNRDAAGFAPVNSTGIIGVSAIDNQLQRAGFSNRVNRIEMAVAAPGVGIYSTKPNNTYAAHNGTSMAAPYVSGIIGIMKSVRPSLTNKEAFKILQQTGKNTQDTQNTGKLIQPAAALQAVLQGS
ncbi:MAG: S8 family serine peptidase [Bacteroidota bacterium]